MDWSDWQSVTFEVSNMLTSLFSGILFLHIAWIASKSWSNAPADSSPVRGYGQHCRKGEVLEHKKEKNRTPHIFNGKWKNWNSVEVRKGGSKKFKSIIHSQKNSVTVDLSFFGEKLWENKMAKQTLTFQLGTQRPNVSEYARSVSNSFLCALEACSQRNFGTQESLSIGVFFVSSESVNYHYGSGESFRTWSSLNFKFRKLQGTFCLYTEIFRRP